MSLRARTDALIAAVDIRRTTTIKGDVRALAAALGVPFNGVAGRRLGDSLTGRTLLALLALPDHDLSRTAVMALLASGAVLGVDGLPVPAAASTRRPSLTWARPAGSSLQRTGPPSSTGTAPISKSRAAPTRSRYR